MAAPTLQAQGATVANTTGSLTVTLAAHQADDILLLCLIIWAPNSAVLPIASIPTPSGWTSVGTVDFDSGAGIDGRIAWFWKRATSGAETNPVCTRGSGWDTGTDTCFGGRAYTIRGCVTTGDPWDEAEAAGPYDTANQAFAAITVSGTERMVVQFGCSMDDAAFAMTSSGWTTGTEDNDPTGTDCSFQTARKDNVSASTSADTATVSAPAQGAYGFMGISFKPPSTGLNLNITGSAATGSPGTLAPAEAAAVSGLSASGSPGTAVANRALAVTGLAATPTVGTVAPNLAKALTGLAATLGVGSLIANRALAASGVSATGSPGTIATSGGTPVADLTFKEQPTRIQINRAGAAISVMTR